jgi:Lon protease-like protein
VAMPRPRRPVTERSRPPYDVLVSDTLRCVVTERALVPGSTMSVMSSDAGHHDGDLVVVVHSSRDRGVAAVGTVATVDETRATGGDTTLLTVTGLYLAAVRHNGDSAAVEPIDREDAPEASSAISAAASALRAYMAARSEAGEGGDVHATLSGDPVAASNQVASHLRISWPEIQEILEAGDACARLERGSAVLERETELLRAVMGRSDE